MHRIAFHISLRHTCPNDIRYLKIKVWNLYIEHYYYEKLINIQIPCRTKSEIKIRYFVQINFTVYIIKVTIIILYF